MKKTTTILGALSLGIFTATAGVAPAPVHTGKSMPPPPADPCAGPISYNNIELLYANTNWDGGGDNSDGVRLNVEYSPMQNVFLTAGVEYATDDYADAWLLNLGVGGYVPLTNNIDLAADAGLLYYDVDYDRGGSDSDTGWYVRPHLRAKFGCLTVHAGAMYADVADSEEWSWFANVYYQLNANWDITAGIRDNDEAQTITAGVRYRY